MSNDLATTKSGHLAVIDSSPIAYLLDTARFEHCYRIAKLMASASLIPDHLKIGRDKRPLEPEQIAANCFMIVNQSLRWGFDPFSVAPETYVVGGKLAFQGKLIMAAINALAGLEERLNFTFTGKVGTPELTITVSGRFKGEREARTVSVSVAQARTDNDMWKKDPEQKLVYTGSIKWARRHCPEVVMGIMLEDEMDEPPMRNITPTHGPDPVAAALLPADSPAPAKRTRREPPEVAPAQAKAQSPIVEKAELVRNLMAAKNANGITLPRMAEIFREAGLVQGATMNEATLDELKACWTRVELLGDAEPEQKGEQ